MDYALILTEGPHDQAFIQRLFKVAFAFHLFDGDVSKLDRFWKPLIPQYPSSSGKLYTRLPMPSIVYSDVLSVAIYVAGSFEQVLKYGQIIPGSVANGLVACGIVVDSDKRTPETTVKMLRKDLMPYLANLPNKAGKVSSTTPRHGVYVLPDNIRPGTLEDVLLSCAGVVYPDLKKGTEAYLSSVNEQWKARWQPADGKKATVGCISNILKPGKANQVSIADNDWVSPSTLHVSQVDAFRRFLEKLLNL